MAYAHVVQPGKRFKLSSVDPGDHDGMERDKAERITADLGAEMAELQDLMFFAGRNALLILLQGLDTSGKDGLIRHLLSYTNVQSCRVVPFKIPTPLELSHDFLWRIHAETPGKGGMTIFNRSQYEDVLVVRVHKLVAEEVWKGRYDHINHFEELLTNSGVILLKFFLHISKDEQEQRLLDREKDPTKAWKLSLQDWRERELWNDYMEAYEDALNKCSTSYAPWHVVPSNHKWFRTLAVSERIVSVLRPYRNDWSGYLKQLGAKERAELEAYRRKTSKTSG